MKIIIAGGRYFNDYLLLENKLDYFIFGDTDRDDPKFESYEIVSGTAKGADQFGERYAISRLFTIKRFPADWDTHGKSAGYKRNEEMAKYADACVVFWDGKSKGTKHMIDLAKKYNLKLRIVRYE